MHSDYSASTGIQAEADSLTLHTLKQRQIKHALSDLLSLKSELVFAQCQNATSKKCTQKVLYASFPFIRWVPIVIRNKYFSSE